MPKERQSAPWCIRTGLKFFDRGRARDGVGQEPPAPDRWSERFGVLHGTRVVWPGDLSRTKVLDGGALWRGADFCLLDERLDPLALLRYERQAVAKGGPGTETPTGRYRTFANNYPGSCTACSRSRAVTRGYLRLQCLLHKRVL